MSLAIVASVLALSCLVGLSLASALDLCALDANDTVASSNFTWSEVLDRPVRQFVGASYLRPDIGGALMPYVYTAVMLILHIPVVIIRVVRYETVQTWCLVGTLFTVAVTVQTYVSTGFEASQILTWTPLMLVIDAGSMAQVFFLVVEDFDLTSRVIREVKELKKAGWRLLLDKLPWRRHEKASDPEIQRPSLNEKSATFHFICLTPESTNRPQKPVITSVFKTKPLPTAVIALLLLFTVLILQFIGLFHAVKHARAPTPAVSWCSPFFAPFGIAVLDGNCSLFPIQQTVSKGVGCILIPGEWEMSWLHATVAGTSISLALEFIDILVLALVGSKTRWRGIKMRRPWATMFCGIAVLGLIFVFGVVYSETLPPGIAERVWVVDDAGILGINEGLLGVAGLRGAIIGWNDGLFSGWGKRYFGTWGG